MKKVLLIATVQSHIAQFHKPLIKWLEDNGYQVDIGARYNLDVKPSLHLTVKGDTYDIPFSRSPFSLKNIRAYSSLNRIINDGGYAVVHCNTPVAGILTRIAANTKRKEGETKVIYEAHGFHFYKGGPKRNWILWYPLEKWFSKYANVLITINKMDYALANRKFKAERVEYIPGVGLNLHQFEDAKCDSDLRSEFDLPESAKIVLSVGELNKNKNHQVIIHAIAYLNDPQIHYFLAGNGPLDEKLTELAKELGVEKNVHFLGYRRDVPSLLKNADVYAFPSRREGLGMASIEAMASGLPLVTSNRHGINDYSEDGVTGFKYDPDDYRGFADGIHRIVYDNKLKQKMGEHNIGASKQFTIEESMGRVSRIYQELLDDAK